MGGLPPAPAVCHHLLEMRRCVDVWFFYGGHDPA